MEETDQSIVSAHSTKEFFIAMLVRDIGLVQAITDLVDNSLDGARKISSTDYSGLWVRIDFNKSEFKIADNCGGISLEVARKYAFCFGRPKDAPNTPHSIGQFGVGMKRALFKIGREFQVDSITKTEFFQLTVDVDTWRESEDWNFRFSKFGEHSPTESVIDIGTTITASKIHPAISTEFSSDSFATRLKSDIEVAHQKALENGLNISINGIPLRFKQSLLFSSDILKPAYEEFEVEKGDVKVKLYAGISDSSPSDAGWNIYCNGRVILEADKTSVTGWGEDDAVSIPIYHNQFSRFRGYVFFDSDDAYKLPWNTTKSAVDEDSPVWRTCRQRMLINMRPVIDFLNQLDREKDSEQEQVYTESIQNSNQSPIEQLELSEFSPPETPQRHYTPQKRNISYSVPADEAKRAMDVAEVSTLREIGEYSFQYFYKRECE
jgi:hypothetical protein